MINRGNRYVGNERYFIYHMMKYVGETVTIFTASGGASGCGFTGILMDVNPYFLRLSVKQSTPPPSPLSYHICDNHKEWDNDSLGYNIKHNKNNNYNMNEMRYEVGSVVDIPINRIVAFCHNGV